VFSGSIGGLGLGFASGAFVLAVALFLFPILGEHFGIVQNDLVFLDEILIAELHILLVEVGEIFALPLGGSFGLGIFGHDGMSRMS
jgi:hypothetical protein